MEIHRQVVERSSKFRGSGRDLETALGCYSLGSLYGWRVLYMVNSQSHLRKVEKTLGIPFKDVCPETTELSTRCFGYRTAKAADSFWSVIRGNRNTDPLRNREIFDGKTGS